MSGGIVFKRPGSPYFYVTRTRQSTKTTNRKQAEEFARQVLSAVWRQTTLGEYNTTWKELAASWVSFKGNKKSIDVDNQVIRDMATVLPAGSETPLVDITTDLVSEYAELVKSRSSANTANRHLTVVAAMLMRAKRKGLLPQVPEVERFPEGPKKEIRWLTHEEFNTFVSFLPSWVADMATFAVQTGLRYSNVAHFKWSWITSDGKGGIVPAVSAKTQRTYTPQLSQVAQQIIERNKGKHPEYVFTDERGNAPVLKDGAIRYYWNRACKKSGIKVRFHDLRHTWASWHVQAGTPDRIIMLSGGWTNLRMLDNYAHLNTSHLAEHAENINK